MSKNWRKAGWVDISTQMYAVLDLTHNASRFLSAHLVAARATTADFSWASERKVFVDFLGRGVVVLHRSCSYWRWRTRRR